MTNLFDTAGRPHRVFTTAGRIIWDTEESPAPLHHPRRQVLGASRPVNGSYRVGPTQMTTRQRKTLWENANNLVLSFNNLSGLAPGINAYTVKCAFESEGGEITAVTFDGKEETLVEPGNIISSDPLNLSAGSYFLRTYARVNEGECLPLTENLYLLGPGEGTSLDKDLTYTSGDLVRNIFAGFTACSAIADGNGPAVAVIGDSVSVGLGDSSGAGGAYEVGLSAASVPSVLAGKGGSRSHQMTEAYLKMVMPSDPGVTHMLVEHGLNTSSEGSANQQRAAVGLWKRLRQLYPEVKLVQCTINPYTKSTDGWASTESQVEFYPGVQGAFNAWIRAGAPLIGEVPAAPGTAGAISAGGPGHPLAGVLDVGAAIESSMGSNLWGQSPGGTWTADGLHPNTLGALTMSVPIAQWAEGLRP